MYILLVGSDSRSNGYIIGLADSINVVRVDFVEARVQLLSFQRDLYVEVPGIENHNVTMGKLNQAFLYGNPGYGYYDGVGQGPGLLALTLEHNFGAQVDHYVAVNMQAFVKIVDTLGGINIDLPYVVDGRVKGSRDPDRYFPSGRQYLNGYRTMLLARMRPMGVFRRSEVQNLILQALSKKLLTTSVIRKLPDLIDTFYAAVQTDLGVEEVGQLVCLAAKLDVHKIEFFGFPDDLFKGGRVSDPVLGYTSVLNVDFEILKRYVRAFNKGTWPGLEETLEDGLIIP
jgi:LCP family protein required for cell wall assembly